MMFATIVGLCLFTTTQSQSPAVGSEGSNLVFTIPTAGTIGVDTGGILTMLHPAPIDPSITGTVSSLVDSVASQQIAMNDMASTMLVQANMLLSQNQTIAAQTNMLLAHQNTIALLSDTLENTTTDVGANRNRIVDNEDATGDLTYELGALGKSVDNILLELIYIEGNKSGPALRKQLAELTDLVQKVRHPIVQTVYGNWVIGDDVRSRGLCPNGLAVSKCTVEAIGASTSEYRSDGIRLDLNPNGCSAYAGAHAGTIRVATECSNLHNVTKLIGDTEWQKPKHAITCPDNMRALHCLCYSAWGFCNADAFGFSPISNTTCQAIHASNNHRLSAICVDNSL